MELSNQAFLSHNGISISSNRITGSILPAMSLAKLSAEQGYRQGSRISYLVLIANHSTTAYSQLSLLDNFGRYDWQTLFRFPLSYVDGSAQLWLMSANGPVSGSVTYTVSTDGITFLFDLPAQTTALLSYNADVSPSAPLPVGSFITNTVTLSRPSPAPALTASHQLPVESYADVEIAKSGCTEPGTGQPVSYRIVLSNYGNAATDPQDSLIVTDRLEPLLTNLTVTANGAVWSQGIQYDYDAASGLFTTLPGAFGLPAAGLAQNSFGTWIVTPSSFVLTLSGTLQTAPAAQAAVQVVSAYTDGREVNSTVSRLQNDHYELSFVGEVVPKYHISTDPDCPLALLPTSDARFTLDRNILTVDNSASALPGTAYVLADHRPGSFTVQLDYL